MSLLESVRNLKLELIFFYICLNISAFSSIYLEHKLVVLPSLVINISRFKFSVPNMGGKCPTIYQKVVTAHKPFSLLNNKNLANVSCSMFYFQIGSQNDSV